MQRGSGSLGRHRRFWCLIWLVAVVVLLPFSGLAAAQGDERLAFLDEAPLEFDLSQAPGATQMVEVINGDTRALDRLELRVSGLPEGVVVVEEPERTALQPGQVATFTVVRRSEGTLGEGRLVAVGSNGAVARRTVVLAAPSTADDDLDEVTIRAWRMWPFSGWFDVDTVKVEGSTGTPADGPSASSPRRPTSPRSSSRAANSVPPAWARWVSTQARPISGPAPTEATSRSRSWPRTSGSGR